MKKTSFFIPVFFISQFFYFSISAIIFAESKVVAVLPFENLHKKPHLEFVKNIVHEKMFTQLGSGNPEVVSSAPLRVRSQLPVFEYVVIGVSSLEDAKKLFKLSGGKVPAVVLQGEYFMIRDRMALNISLLNPKDGSRMDGTGELVVYKGNRHPELQGQSNFQQSLYEDIQEPLNKLIIGIQDLIEGKKKATEATEGSPGGGSPFRGR